MITRKKQITIASIIGIIILAGIIFAINRKPQPGVAVQVHTVSTKTIAAQISSVGIVEANDVEIIYSDTYATVSEILVELGDQIKAGDTLMRFKSDHKLQLERDLSKLKLQLSSANLVLNDLSSQASKQDILQAELALAQVEKSENNIKDTIATQELDILEVERQLITATNFKDKQKELLDAGIIAQQEYDDQIDIVKALEYKIETKKINLAGSKKSLESISSEKTKAQHDIDLAYNKISDKKKNQLIATKQNEIQTLNIEIAQLQDELAKVKLEVKSTISGVVSEIMVNKESMVEAGSPLVTILDVSSLKVIAEVSTFDAPQVALGQTVTITQDNLEKTKYTGKVIDIAPSAIEKKSGTTSRDILPITIAISDDKTQLKPGFSVDVDIQTASKDNALTLPILSIMEDADEDYQYVFIVRDDNTLEKRKIQEITLDSMDVEVVGLAVGERVVANPTEDLSEGTLIVTTEFHSN